VLGWLWRGAAWIIIGVVYAVSWLAFVVTLFRDVRFTTHFMECEIGDLDPTETRQYLIDKQQEYTRRLSYGSVPVKEQKRIDKTFEYLFAKYPAHVEDPLPDPVAERHAQVIETITDAKTAIVESVTADNNRRISESTERLAQEAERHAQVVGGIAEVKTAMNSVVGYTDRKSREDAERQEREAEQLASAEKRREQSRSRSGFVHNPEDLCPKLSDAQFALLTKGINEIGVFRRDVTQDEITRLFLCEHTKPLHTTHNKMIALILEKLCAGGLITPKWQRVAASKMCFASKHGKPLTAKNLSSAKQTAELIPEKKYKMILDCIEAIEALTQKQG
jgi:hypothetical protein